MGDSGMKSRLRGALALVGSLALVVSACGDDDDDASTGATDASDGTTAPADGSAPATDAGDGEEVTLSLLIDDTETTNLLTTGVTEAFTELHPNITFDIETRPGGADGDNIVKTRLSTGEMSDVFFYNSGSLMQALNPEQSMVEITGDPMLDDVVDAFIPTVTQNDKVFGVPFGTGIGGGILYNKPIFEEQGLEVPVTWEEFEANNDALKEAGITPVGASFGTTWTSQLFVLADYHNVAQAEPNFAEDYTANKAKYATTPAALTSFERLQEASDKGWWNEDYGSATFEDAQAMLLDGEIAQYPMLTFVLPALEALDAEKAQDIGFFAQPGPDAETNGMTLWMPAGAYIAATTDHPEEAKEFLAFIASVEGTEAQTAAAAPAGPYLIEGATLPDDVLPAVNDVEAYIESGKVTPALEFLSPIKGPELEHITVEVGSGLRDAADAAALYDKDVEKQAQQLGLEGW
jgi:raffinose/stachyose/melibiose transport system substrate-binding protein